MIILKIELLSYTANGLSLQLLGRYLCRNRLGQKRACAALESRHESIIEHIVYTFRIKKVTKFACAVIKASFGKSSGRITTLCKQDGFKYVVPPSIPEHLVNTYIANVQHKRLVQRLVIRGRSTRGCTLYFA